MRSMVKALALLVIVLSVVIGLVVFAIPFLSGPADRGATLTITLSNGTDTVHIVYVTTSVAEDGTRVGFSAVAVPPGGVEKVTLDLDDKYNGVPLEIVFDDQTAGGTSTRSWTPSAGAKEEMDYSCSAG